MKNLWGKVRALFKNKWVKFIIVAVVYLLWFVIWWRNLWMLIGIPIIFDIYISKYMYRWLGGAKHKERKKNKTYRELSSWIEAILFAVILAAVLHISFFQLYQIPTPSMEKTLLVGDRVFVSKLAFGPRMSFTPLSLPLIHNTLPFSQTKKSYSTAIQRPYKRLKGWGSVQRGDIVVFNFPAGDTVVIGEPMPYQQFIDDYTERFGADEGRQRLWRDYNITWRPIDKREHYVKRCVGVGGDTIEIIDGQVYIDGEPQENYPGLQHNYIVRTSGTPLGSQMLANMDIASDEVSYNRSNGVYVMPLTQENVEKMESVKNVVSVERYRSFYGIGTSLFFPNHKGFNEWSEDNFGPLWIPKKGETVNITVENLPLYERIIKVYEGNELDVRDGNVLINNEITDSYTFKMNYYFMMGDNRNSSLDSRFWGFVPEDHIVGRPVFVLYSTDKNKLSGSNIRWNRIFTSLR